MAQNGISEEIMLSFIDSAGTFNMGADQIIYLHDLGVSNEVITAMILHDSEIASGQLAMTLPTAKISAPSFQTAFVPAHSPVEPGPPETTPPPPAPQAPEVAANPFPEEDYLPAPSEPEPAPELYPVRKPYPVKLLDPIIVYRMEPRHPNIQILYDFP